MEEILTVFTDGACKGNPGPGGWGWWISDEWCGSGTQEEATTNQRMEIQAVLEAIRFLPDVPLVIYSDSKYVVNCFNDGWWKNWVKRDWVRKGNRPVANRDLWEPLIEAIQERDNEVIFEWVKGHAGIHGNEKADQLATGAIGNV